MNACKQHHIKMRCHCLAITVVHAMKHLANRFWKLHTPSPIRKENVPPRFDNTRGIEPRWSKPNRLPIDRDHRLEASFFEPIQDSVSERLRRWTRNPWGSACRGSNPLAVDAALVSDDDEPWNGQVNDKMTSENNDFKTVCPRG